MSHEQMSHEQMSYWTRLPVVFTVRLVVLLVVHHEVRQREAVVCAYEVDAVLWVAPGPPLPPAVVAPPAHKHSYSVRNGGLQCEPVSPLRKLSSIATKSVHRLTVMSSHTR